MATRVETVIVAASILGLGWFGSARAQCVDYNDYLNWVGSSDINPSAAGSIEVSGTHAYVLADRFRVLDLSTPASPVTVATLDNYATRLAVSGDYAYLIHEFDGLTIIDISVPASPVFVTNLAIVGGVDVAVAGQYAYVAGGYSGVHVVDVSTPAAPAIVGNVPSPDYSYGVAVSGNYLYVGAVAGGLQVVDISVPESPAVVGGVPTAVWAYRVAVSGNYAYVLGDLFQVVDVSDPTMPVATGTVDYLSEFGLDGFFRSAVVSGNHVLAATSYGGLVVVDVASPEAPSIIGNIEAPAATDVAISGDYAYVSDISFGVHVADITELESVAIVGNVDTPYAALGVAVQGNHAYVADGGDGLQVVNVTTPESPAIVGHADTPGFSNSVAVSGNYAYIADGTAGLSVVNVSTPASPVFLTSVDTGSANDVAVAGNYAYVADGSGLKVVDVSAPGAPSIVGSAPTMTSYGVAVQGNYAYVTSLFLGLVVVDVSNPASPSIVGSVDMVEGQGVAVFGEYAYVASTYYVHAVDITAPSSPTIVASWPTIRAGTDAAIQGDYLYVADGYISDGAVGIHVLDISVPGTLTAIGDVNTWDARGVAVLGDYVYVADLHAGLTIVPAQCNEPSLPVLITRFDASVRGQNVLVSWDVWSDEALESYQLYRSDDARTQSILVAEGPLDAATRSYLDAAVKPGHTYRYELVIHSQAGNDLRSQPSTVTVPRLVTVLGDAYPNPFRSSTSIEYSLGERAHVTVGIYDVAGRVVARLDQGDREAGSHRVEWNGRDARGSVVGSGVYFYRLEGTRQVAPRKMVRLR